MCFLSDYLFRRKRTFHVSYTTSQEWGFPGGAVVKNPPANAGIAGDTGLIPVSGRSPGVGNGSTL